MQKGNQMTLKSENSLELFYKFTTSLSNIDILQVLQNAEKTYAIKEFKITKLTIDMAIGIYQNIYLKSCRNVHPKSELNWWENQLRIFIWVMILYAESKKIPIKSLNSQDWEFFSNLFPNKQQILFEYQSINIIKDPSQVKKWAEEEDKLFVQLVNQKGLKCKWSEIAKLLYMQSDRNYFRTPKQCRQRWLNHLDPSKLKIQWSMREDYVLIREVFKKKKRWAQISKLLHNKRNEHSIKNRFKSLITREQKLFKEKLEQSELVRRVFKRYANHFNKIKGNLNQENYQFFDVAKIEDQKKITALQQKQFQENQQYGENEELKLKSQAEKLMYPFKVFPKTKEQQSFTPFRKLHEFFSCNEFQNGGQVNENSMILKNFTSMENLVGLTGINPGNLFIPKAGCSVELKNGQNCSEECSYASILKTENLKEHEMMNEPFLNQDKFQFGFNYEQFLPREVEKDEDQDQMSIQNQFEEQSNNMTQNRNQQSEQSQVDQEQKRIRAQIFMVEDPFDLLKQFFSKKRDFHK